VQGWRLLPGLLVTQWALLLVPTLAVLAWMRIDIRETLALRWTGWQPLAGAVVVGGAWAVVALQLGFMQEQLFPKPPELIAEMEALFAGHSVWLLALAIAVSPAICEEVVFRGAILKGLMTRLPAWAAIGLTALFFSLVHLSLWSMGTLLLSGVVLGYVRVRGGSLYCSVLAHLMVNLLGVLAGAGALPRAALRVIEESERRGLGWPVLLGGLAALAAGVALIEWRARRTR
jgi:sodium transport system permease protein